MSTPAGPLLKVDHLRTYIRARRGLVHAVDGVSFELYAGETLAVVGESGCGKSVLCRTIMGLLPEKGCVGHGASIEFDGNQLIGLTERQYNRFRATQMAMIFQDPLSCLNPVMPVGRQIAEPLRRHLKLGPGQADRRAVQLIRAVGLPDAEQCAGYYPHQLSGGMRQRIAIAIALACDPKLLIADEPTTALDVTVQAGILALLSHLQVRTGLSLMMVTHDLAVASNVADRIAVMYAGKIVEIAPGAALIHGPRHPYTQALIEAIPKIGQTTHTSTVPIEGQPCDLVFPPPGCRFSTRCPRAEAPCRVHEPVLKANPASDHRYACWFPREG